MGGFIFNWFRTKFPKEYARWTRFVRSSWRASKAFTVLSIGIIMVTAFGGGVYMTKKYWPNVTVVSIPQLAQVAQATPPPFPDYPSASTEPASPETIWRFLHPPRPTVLAGFNIQGLGGPGGTAIGGDGDAVLIDMGMAGMGNGLKATGHGHIRTYNTNARGTVNGALATDEGQIDMQGGSATQGP